MNFEAKMMIMYHLVVFLKYLVVIFLIIVKYVKKIEEYAIDKVVDGIVIHNYAIVNVVDGIFIYNYGIYK